MEASLTYSDGERTNTYGLSLLRVAPDNLRFAEETLRYHQAGRAEPVLVLPGGGGEESRLMALARSSESSPEANTARVLRSLLGRTSVYHFHDTSDEARVKRTWRLADNRHLKWDGGNLAPVLHRLREEHRAHYDRIEGVIRQVVPFFGNFVLEPTAARPDHHILLEWRERGSDLHFGAYQLSDGTLRFMLLATLLGMPEERFARVVIIDEPELGLHPAALEALGNMVYSASSWTQVILTTQSAALLDVFDPEDVVVVSRVREEAGRYETQFRRLAGADLAAWEEFSLGELWDKNVLGGRPMA
jgi:predicted ATPase